MNLIVALLVVMAATIVPCAAASKYGAKLAATPPMGWNDWAHYQCGYTAATILANARALVKTGLAADGYKTVTIDDCWMQKHRNHRGNLQADPKRFPRGMKAIGQALHSMGLRFGIYEDAGYATCDGLAGSGTPNGGGKAHFAADARLFASWGVDYLKLDACNVYVPPGSNKVEARRKAYSAESSALKATGRPIVFSESATDCCRFDPGYYGVLSWIGRYGQLWRTGNDVATFSASDPRRARFPSVLWNYTVNLQLARYQKPGNWDDPDFVIGGDPGMGLAQTRSQMALYSMMSSPLNLSSDVTKLSPQAIRTLGNKRVIAIDQDPLGKMATLVERTPNMDVLVKPLQGGDYAVAILDRSPGFLSIRLHPAELGFRSNSHCAFHIENLWSGITSSSSLLNASVAGDDTRIWRLRPNSGCGVRSRTGDITMAIPLPPGSDWQRTHPNEVHPSAEQYTRCLSSGGAQGSVSSGECAGTPAERWTYTARETLKSGSRCLAIRRGEAAMVACAGPEAERWRYNLTGNLIDSRGRCLTAVGSFNNPQRLSALPCGYNRQNQIWSLPN